MICTGRFGRWHFGWLLVLIVLITWQVLAAQPAAPVSSTPQGAGAFVPQLGEGLMVWQLYMLSPVINSVILFLSIAALALFVYFLATVKGHSMAPRRFVDEVSKLVRSRDFKEVADYCRDHPHVLCSTIVQSGSLT